MSDRRVRAVAAVPLPEALAERIRAAEPRLDLIVEHDLLPQQRWPGDHEGAPLQRSDEDEQRYRRLVDSAEVLYGAPDDDAEGLARTVRANAGLRWVQLMAAGAGGQVKQADLSDADLHRVAFTTTAGVHAVPLAEFCEFGLLAGFKGLPILQDQQRHHEWGGSRRSTRLEDSRVLVVGLGHIGRLVAERLAAQGARVAGTSRRRVEVKGVREVIHPRDLARRIGDFDGVVVTLPGTDETHHLVSAEVLGAVAEGVTIVNVGRGTVIDQDALIAGLSAGRVGFAALDVTDPEPLPADSPLWDLPNALISPHTAARSDAEDDLIATLFARNATRYADGEGLLNRVDVREFY